MYFVFTQDIFTFYPQCCSYRAVESRGLIRFIPMGFVFIEDVVFKVLKDLYLFVLFFIFYGL